MARMASVVSSAPPARLGLIRVVRPRNRVLRLEHHSEHTGWLLHRGHRHRSALSCRFGGIWTLPMVGNASGEQTL